MPARDSVVELDGAEVGRVTSAAQSAALGPVALAVLGRAVAVGQIVTVGRGDDRLDATVAELPLR